MSTSPGAANHNVIARSSRDVVRAAHVALQGPNLVDVADIRCGLVLHVIDVAAVTKHDVISVPGVDCVCGGATHQNVITFVAVDLISATFGKVAALDARNLAVDQSELAIISEDDIIAFIAVQNLTVRIACEISIATAQDDVRLLIAIDRVIPALIRLEGLRQLDSIHQIGRAAQRPIGPIVQIHSALIAQDQIAAGVTADGVPAIAAQDDVLTIGPGNSVGTLVVIVGIDAGHNLHDSIRQAGTQAESGRGGKIAPDAPLPELDSSLVAKNQIVAVGGGISRCRVTINHVVRRAAQNDVVAFIPLDSIIPTVRIGGRNRNDISILQTHHSPVAQHHVIPNFAEENVISEAADDNVVATQTQAGPQLQPEKMRESVVEITLAAVAKD